MQHVSHLPGNAPVDQGQGLAGLSPTSGNSARAQGEAGRAALRAIVGSGEYFLATLPDGSRLVQPIPRGVRHPLNFGREARPPRRHGKRKIRTLHGRRVCVEPCVSGRFPDAFGPISSGHRHTQHPRRVGPLGF